MIDNTIIVLFTPSWNIQTKNRGQEHL